jgi:hypothetical protein
MKRGRQQSDAFGLARAICGKDPYLSNCGLAGVVVVVCKLYFI